MADTQADRDRRFLSRAVELASRCEPSDSAFSVGAIIVAHDGTVLGSGWSRRHDPHEHAEEATLDAVVDEARHRLVDATIYTSLEPCSRRASRPVTCTEHVIQAGIPRIVFAWSEPDTFVEGAGAQILRSAGREVVQIDDLADAARAPNRHLTGGDPPL